MNLCYYSTLVQFLDLIDILDFKTCLPGPTVLTCPSLPLMTMVFLSYGTNQLTSALCLCPYSVPGTPASLACLLAQLHHLTTYFLGFGGQHLRNSKLIFAIV